MKLDVALLASLFGGPVQHERLLRLHTPLGPNVLLAETLDGVEAVAPATGHAGFRLELTALSTSTHPELKQLIGQPVLLELLTGASRTALRPWHGHVTQFSLLGSDGGLARYRLVVEPWLALLAHRTDSRSFQGMTVPEVLEAVFGRYQAHGKLAAAWRFEFADAGVYPQRSLVTQYQESDLAFVLRLLAEEGLFAWFEHQGDATSESLGVHTLVIADHNGAVKPGAQARVRFAQSGASFKEDTLTRWGATAQVTTAAIELQSWDYRQNALRPVRADGAAAAGLPPLVRRDLPGVYVYETREPGERIAQRQQQTLDAAARLCEARGGFRMAAPATTFELAEHASAGGRYTVMAVRHRARNNLAADAQAGIARLLGLAAPREEDTPLYECDLVALPAELPVRALGLDVQGAAHVHELTTLLPRPAVHGTQTAIVVSDGAPIHTDRDHRIKVQFHWQRGGQASHRLADEGGDDNAPANDRAGTWVRVATPLAGANWGSVFTPRAGQEVVVEFLEGDIDRPVVVGSVYNGVGQANAQGNQAAGGAAGSTGNAPAWFPGDARSGALQGHQHNAVQVGFKTQEVSASASGTGGANQLVFDASPGEARVLLATSTANSRLQLGHLLYQRDNQRLQHQGHGAELFTSAYGALRAGSGLLISTHGRQASTGSAQQLDTRETQTQLDASRELQLALAKAAQQHQARIGSEPEPEKLPVAEGMAGMLEVLQAVDTLALATAAAAGAASEAEGSEASEEATSFDEQIQFLNAKGTPLANVAYELKLADGSVETGQTDAQGLTQRVVTAQAQPIVEAKLSPRPLESCCTAHAQQAGSTSAAALVVPISGVATNPQNLGASVVQVQTPKGKARPMTPGEIAMAKVIFKDSIDYSKVKVHNGEYLWFGLQPDNTAMTPNGEMYFNPDYFKEDFSKEDSADKHWFMHEMVHVWQYQLDYPVKLRGAIRIGLSYAYQLAHDKTLADYNMEAQGDIVADYFALKVLGDPTVMRQQRYANALSDYEQYTLKTFLADPADRSSLPGGS